MLEDVHEHTTDIGLNASAGGRGGVASAKMYERKWVDLAQERGVRGSSKGEAQAVVGVGAPA